MNASANANAREATNAVIRLHRVLSMLMDDKMNGPTANAAVRAFSLADGANALGYMKANAMLLRMIESSDHEIRSNLSSEVDFYVPVLDSVREALTLLYWGTEWQPIRPRLKPEYLTALAHTGQRLKQLVPEVHLAGDEIAALLEAIKKLEELTLRLNIPDQIRSKLLGRLGDMEQAISDYRFHGIGPVELQFEATVGIIGPYLRQVQEDEPARYEDLIGSLRRIMELIGYANTAYTAGHHLRPLLTGISHLALGH